MKVNNTPGGLGQEEDGGLAGEPAGLEDAGRAAAFHSRIWDARSLQRVGLGVGEKTRLSCMFVSLDHLIYNQ